jgi:LysM repeat protein
MSSIRPLITITILVAVGVFMFMKINEGPVALPPETEAALEQSAATDLPPLTPTTDATAAPAWNDPSNAATATHPQVVEGASESVAAAPLVPPVSLPSDNATASVSQESTVASTPADLPPIPELPPATVPDTNTTPPLATTEPAQASPIPLPANIPIAQYPGDTATTAESIAAAPVAAPGTEVAAIPSPSAYAAATPPTTEPVTPAVEATPQTTPPVVTRVAPQATTDDRYGMMAATEPVAPLPTTEAVTPTAPQPATAATPTFASEWPQIQAALDRQELVAAHEMLSRWYGNPTLTPAEAQQVEATLSQLAGTVVYSTEHRLEPPYTVHAGDTLQTIAQQYDVPWQLLAKINGIPAANAVQPGQQLKVVHGPFSAIVELDEKQLTLMLDGRYAGRFPITIPDGATASEGQWVLEQKLVNPTTDTSGVVSASYTPSAVDHVLVLRSESPTAGGATISITSGKPAPSGPTAVAPAAIRLAPRDVEEVADILSVGSPVMIRR